MGRERVFAILGDFPRVWDALTQEEQKVLVRSVLTSVEVLGRGFFESCAVRAYWAGLSSPREARQEITRHLRSVYTI